MIDGQEYRESGWVKSYLRSCIDFGLNKSAMVVYFYFVSGQAVSVSLNNKTQTFLKYDLPNVSSTTSVSRQCL